MLTTNTGEEPQKPWNCPQFVSLEQCHQHYQSYAHTAFPFSPRFLADFVHDQVDHTMHVALDKYAFFAVTGTLTTLEYLIGLLETENAKWKEYHKQDISYTRVFKVSATVSVFLHHLTGDCFHRSWIPRSVSSSMNWWFYTRNTSYRTGTISLFFTKPTVSSKRNPML